MRVYAARECPAGMYTGVWLRGAALLIGFVSLHRAILLTGVYLHTEQHCSLGVCGYTEQRCSLGVWLHRAALLIGCVIHRASLLAGVWSHRAVHTEQRYSQGVC